MKKILLLLLCVLLIFSCGESDQTSEKSSHNYEGMKKKEDTYQVLKIIKDKSVLTESYDDNYKLISKIEELTEREESLAYTEGFESFCMSVKVNEMMRERVGGLYSETKSFKLLKNNIDITNEMELSNKNDIHNKTINSVFQSAPELLNKAESTLKTESIKRYRVLFDQENLKQFKTLYEDLLVFKDSPDFHSWGFGTGGIYYKWLKATEEFPDYFSRSLLIEYGFGTGDLTTLGIIYLGSKGSETEYTNELNKSIINSFK